MSYHVDDSRVSHMPYDARFESELGSMPSIIGNPDLSKSVDNVNGNSDGNSASRYDYAKMNGDMLETARKAGKARRHPGECDESGDGQSEGAGRSNSSLRGGGSIFEQIALAMGEAMDRKLQELLDAAKQVNLIQADGEPGEQDQNAIQQNQKELMTANALVTARGQELTMMSQSYQSAINALGGAAKTAGTKSA